MPTTTAASTTPLEPVSPRLVRYIKLGEGGCWERECIDTGIIRLGFDSATSTHFDLCTQGRWTEFRQTFIDDGRKPGTATRFTNETRIFFEDDGSTLWLTFVGEHLWWGFMDGTPARPHPDGDGTFRGIRDGWRCTDIRGEVLTKDKLSGSLTQLAGYRGTSCSVGAAVYAINCINGRKVPEVERGIAAVVEIKVAIQGMLTLLRPKDFELLVDLVFTSSGWRRLGPVGNVQKTLDLDIVLPSTGERAFVQVKSRATDADLADYIQRFEDLGIFSRMFFVQHTGRVSTTDPRVTVIGPQELAELVLDAGLVRWLIEKAS